ncbi:hypothetical protein JMJ35_002026 [Cladonia borealis]|uniref:BTB domain-containing protein n=1 Tax=Cladonia borealis TaxID=184061 RepID=A0AA39R6U5_9LECA|nr:hypothetical protein JMJ35_002026 [Cladonia borealis]
MPLDSDLQARATQADTSSRSNMPSHMYVNPFTGLYLLTQVSNSFNGLVEVIVGPQKQVFRLHKEILCNFSSYFRAALEGSFAEGLTQKIELPEDDVTVFECFRMWLYSPISQKSVPSASELYRYIDVPLKSLFDLYVFADIRDIPLLQNFTMDTIIWVTGRTVTCIGSLIHHVYGRTTPKSPLRKLLVDWWIKFPHLTWLEEQYYGNYSKRFLFEVALAQSKLGPQGSKMDHDLWEARTDYHV